jgi:hypothetical protein
MDAGVAAERFDDCVSVFDPGYARLWSTTPLPYNANDLTRRAHRLVRFGNYSHHPSPLGSFRIFLLHVEDATFEEPP